MRRTFLVAAREYRQVASTRGFWISLLALPVALAVTIISSVVFHPEAGSAYMVIDQTGGRYAAAIEHRLDQDYQREVLVKFVAYVRRWNLASADPGAPWASSRVWFTDQEVEAFEKAGGVDLALRKITPLLPAGAPKFDPPKPNWVRVPAPSGLPYDQGADRVAAALVPHFQGEITTPIGRRSLAAVVYIPRDFGQPSGVAHLWTSGGSGVWLVEGVRYVLTRELKLAAFKAQGLDAPTAARLEALAAPVEVSQPVRHGGRDQLIIRSILPLALVYLLLMTTMTTGALMLQGVIEERSNKLLETVLSCVHPGELMHGKLVGLGAIGLTMVSAWIGCAIAGGYAARGVLAEIMGPALATLDQPWMIAALLFYFLAGYLMVSMVYLAIGSVSDSVQDAQGYMMPVILLIVIPISLMISATFSDPNGPIPRVLSWIPIYTPFAMLARFGTGVSTVEISGTGVLTAVFVVVEYWLMGKIFQTSLLSSGQSLKSLLRGRRAAKA
jgi:ABC-2 type transport system permease protein